MRLNKTKLYQKDNAILWYFPRAFASYQIGDFNSLPWQQNPIRVFGKEYLEPRLTCYFGPQYTYSSVSWPAREFAEELVQIQNELFEYVGFLSNAVLCNYYRNGADSMGWHADNEPEIDQQIIASVSFGATRKMEFRHIQTKERFGVELHHGDVLIMENFQNSWQHAIFKKKVSKPRVNLTFRRIITH